MSGRRWLVEKLRHEGMGDPLHTVVLVVMWTLLAVCGVGVVVASAFGAWAVLTAGWWGAPAIAAVVAGAWWLTGLVVEAIREP